METLQQYSLCIRIALRIENIQHNELFSKYRPCELKSIDK